MLKCYYNAIESGEKMEIGEKIKRLRTAKLMTQAELAGGEITRNMLSRIENGAAQPSMGTVKYIAARLNVSPGFLLAGDEDELLYFKSQEIENIKRAYTQHNFRLCRDMCQNSEWSDDELLLILCESSFRVGEEEFSSGNLRMASELFEEALEQGERTIYDTSVIRAKINAYFEYMQMISPTLSSPDYGDDGRIVMLSDSFCVYSGLVCEANDRGFGDISYVDERVEALGEESSFSLHVKARMDMENGKYREAHTALHRLLYEDRFEIPEPMLYFIFCDLEVCCKEIGDFKGAYEYSGSKISLLQKLIS